MMWLCDACGARMIEYPMSEAELKTHCRVCGHPVLWFYHFAYGGKPATWTKKNQDTGETFETVEMVEEPPMQIYFDPRCNEWRQE